MLTMKAGGRRMLKMIGWAGAAAAALSLLAGCDTLRGTPIPTPTPTVVQVTAQQIAQAMQEDHFFSDYRGDILRVRGMVDEVAQSGGETVVTLSTTIPTVVRCHVTGDVPALTAGVEVTVESPEGQREDGAVGLLRCRILPGS